MIRIILCGSSGQMGKTISELVLSRDDMKIVAGVDFKNPLTDNFPVYSSIKDVKEQADVLIDFSHPSLLCDILEYCKQKNMPAVIATTGIDNSGIELINSYSKNIPIFFTYNMSLGINLLTELIQKAQSVLGDDFDIEIIEKHHNKKIDAPSGTAIMLANALNENSKYVNVYDRHSVSKKRDKNEIGISSVRGGTIVGEHTVIFAGTDETIELTHTAYSKKVFATGSINAAKWLYNKEAGIYSMKDLI